MAPSRLLSGAAAKCAGVSSIGGGNLRTHGCPLSACKATLVLSRSFRQAANKGIRNSPLGKGNFRFLTPMQLVVCGGRSQKEISRLVKDWGISRPLIVTDPTMVSHGKVQMVVDEMSRHGIRGIGVYSDTIAEPSTVEVEKGVEVFKQGNHDGLIALGGGSPIDISKVIGIVAVNGGHVRDYKFPNIVPQRGPPLMAVPTTAGSGSEVSPAAVIKDVYTHENMLCMSPCMIPTAALVDYALSYSCPFRLTADNAIDALTHAIEAYVSVKASPMSDLYALEAIRLISQHIRAVCNDLRNEVGREALMRAATYAGLAFSNSSVALVHGMGRPIGMHFDVPHGLANAMILPTVTRFSAAAAPKRYADCARAMGVGSPEDGDLQACHALVAELESLNRDLKVPTPQEFGINEQSYMHLVELMTLQAVASGSCADNPRSPTTAQIIDLYVKAYSHN